MKPLKRHLILLYLILMFPFVNGQISIPDSEAIWSVYKDKYFVKGDSIFNLLRYNKFFISKNPDLSNESFFALLRQEEDKVYAIRAGENEEKLLYDFSLDLDSNTVVYPIDDMFYGYEITVTVLEKDSILLNGKYRNRLKIGTENGIPYFNEYWIEGIGSTFGLFSSGIQGQLIFDIFYPTLLCFEQNGTLIYDNPNFETCYEVPVSVLKVENTDKIKTWPNPTNSILNIESDNTILEIWISSLSGQKIKHIEPTTKRTIIDLNSIQRGNYILYVRTLNSVLRKKIIKNGL